MNKHFISATREFCTPDRHVPAPLMRKSFTLEKKPDFAEISVCGLGFYLLFVNGKNITKGLLAPYISNPNEICYYDTYDLAKYLVEGENVIGVVLGNGFVNAFGGAVWNFDKADFRSAPRLALDFTAKCGDSEVNFIADESFMTHPSPILFDDIRLGEIYDKRLELPGWCAPGFDASDWTPAIKAETPAGILKKCEVEPIVTIKELKPISITEDGDGYLYDFGINSAGIPKLTVKGECGQKITLRHCEELKDGKFYDANLNYGIIKAHVPEFRFIKDYFQTDRIILSGGEDVFTPSFAYHGFRYIKVEGITKEQATEELLTYLVMSNDVRRIGGFSCSDERINTLYKMADNANRSNMFNIITDCPQREKNGWMGDAALSAEQMALQYDTTNLYRDFLASIRASQNGRGELPAIVPTAGWGFHWGNGPNWDAALFRLTYALYKFRGNLDVVRENAHAMLSYLEYILTRRSPDGTIAIGLGDWASVNKEEHSVFDTPLAVTDTLCVMEMARAAEEMFSAIGQNHSALYAKSIYDDIRDTFRRELIDFDTMTVFGSTQTAQCWALYYGAFNEDEKERAFARLLDLIHEKGDTFDMGCLGLHAIFHVLSEFGEDELAFNMIAGDKFPSYTLLIDKGQTALPEQFYDYGEVYRDSLNHHFLGDTSRWFTFRIAGLEIIDDKTVKINPCRVKSIDFASAYYELPLGKVSVSWKRVENGEIELTYTAPEGVAVIK